MVHCSPFFLAASPSFTATRSCGFPAFCRLSVSVSTAFGLASPYPCFFQSPLLVPHRCTWVPVPRLEGRPYRSSFTSSFSQELVIKNSLPASRAMIRPPHLGLALSVLGLQRAAKRRLALVSSSLPLTFLTRLLVSVPEGQPVRIVLHLRSTVTSGAPSPHNVSGQPPLASAWLPWATRCVKAFSGCLWCCCCLVKLTAGHSPAGLGPRLSHEASRALFRKVCGNSGWEPLVEARQTLVARHGAVCVCERWKEPWSCCSLQAELLLQRLLVQIRDFSPAPAQPPEAGPWPPAHRVRLGVEEDATARGGWCVAGL